MNIHFYNKGSIDTISGGYLYNKEVITHLRSFGHVVEYDENVENLRDTKLNIIDSLVLKNGISYFNKEAKNIGLIHQIDPTISAYEDMKLIVTGKACHQELIHSFDVPEGNIRIVEPGMDVEWRSKAGHSTEIKNLLCIANYLDGKGMDVMLKVLDQLRNYNWTLKIVGNPDLDSNYFNRIQNLVSELKMHDRVELLGTLSRVQINNLMLASDLLVNFSESETYGMVVKEAICAHLPVLMYKTGAWEEFEESGWVTIVNDYSQAAFNNSLSTILSKGIDYENVTALKEEPHRSWEQVSREIENILMDTEN